MAERTPYDAASRIQDYLVFGEFGDVNPSVTDSSTFTFLNPDKMKEAFDHEIEGCFLYSRHWNPSNMYLARALADLEDTESAQVSASGIGAISCTLLQLCQAGDAIVSSRTIYGGTYALLKNLLPRYGIQTRFVNMLDLAAVEAAITPNTKVLYCESISNPLLEIADLRALAALANKYEIKLVVDNTFSPLIFTPKRLGVHIVVHSLTKFINGTSDCVAGCVCADRDFIDELVNINHGCGMLLGPVLDSYRAASILKNLHSLHVRMQQHGRNAMYLATNLSESGCTVHYPGLPTHPQHDLARKTMNPAFGFGGMLALDVGTAERADKLMERMQGEKVGYLAVSLGYFKTLFSSPSSSTSSEIPEDERVAMGLTDGIVRMSVGLDQDIHRTFERIKLCLESLD